MMALLIDRSDPAQRGRTLSTFTLGNDLGLSIGAVMLGVVVDWYGYRPAFSVAAVMAGLAAALFLASLAKAPGQLQPSPAP
jgi:predicted MFS family arabinose efflux permease